MKKKREKIQWEEQEQKNRLSGWNNEEDLGFSVNILKLLEKKITFPSLQSKQSKHPKIKPKQFLPVVQESSEYNSIFEGKVNKQIISRSNQPSLIPIKSEKQIQQISQIKREKIKSVDRRQKYLNKQHQYQLIAAKNMKQQNSSHQLRQFTKSHSKFSRKHLERIENTTKKSQQIWISKHQKMKSVEAAKLNQCEPIFLQKGNSLKLLRRKNLQRYNINSQKMKNYQSKNSIEQKIKIKQGNSLKLKTQNSPHDRLTRMIWMEQFLDNIHPSQRNCKTLVSETEDFQDGHMQMLKRLKKMQ